MAVSAERARIQDLARQGQNVWLDNLGRKLISSGELVRLRAAGVSGITSNRRAGRRSQGMARGFSRAWSGAA
jgi:hypothetical protein